MPGKLRVLPLCLLLVTSHWTRAVQLRGQPAGPAPAPEHIDHETVERFSERGDVDGLHAALVAAFNASARVRGPSEVQLREILTARGAGFTYSSSYKIEHDIEQLKFIAERVGGEKAKEIRGEVLPKYEAMLAKIPPLTELQRTAGLFAFGLAPAEAGALEPYYNRAYHVPEYDPLPRHLHPELDTAKIEREYATSDPSVVVVDNVLSPECLQLLRDALAESTVWYETKMPERFGGYVGAYLNDGLHAKVLLALAQELREALPGILGKHPLRHLWAYKYDDRYTGINLHADQVPPLLLFLAYPGLRKPFSPPLRLPPPPGRVLVLQLPPSLAVSRPHAYTLARVGMFMPHVALSHVCSRENAATHQDRTLFPSHTNTLEYAHLTLRQNTQATRSEHSHTLPCAHALSNTGGCQSQLLVDARGCKLGQKVWRPGDIHPEAPCTLDL